MTRRTKPKVRRDLAVVRIGGEAVIYDERTDAIHHLNGAATVIFSLLDGNSSVDQVAGEIASAFGVPLAEVERQVRATVRRFRAAELLELAPPRNGRTTPRERDRRAVTRSEG